MLKLNRKFILFFLIMTFCFFVFYVFFFFILGGMSLDMFLGFNIILLFVFIYRFFGYIINSYFLNISRNVWVHYVSLITLVINIKQLVFDIGYNYKYLLLSNVMVIYSVFDVIRDIYSSLNSLLIKYYLNSLVFDILLNKFNIIKSVNNSILKNNTVFFFLNSIQMNLVINYQFIIIFI